MPEDIVTGDVDDEALIPPAQPVEVVEEEYPQGDVSEAAADVSDVFPSAEFTPQDIVTEASEELPEVDEPDEELPKFSDKFKNDFEGLLYVGKIVRSFKWMGHSFRIRTPYTHELLEIGLLHQPYIGTISDIKAYQSLVLAAVLVSVDGQSLPLPIDDTLSHLEAKAKFINEHWYPWTVDALYEQYAILDAQIQQVIDNMGKASGATNSTPT